MWKTIKYSVTGKPLIDVNEQGVVYSYQSRQLKGLKQLKRDKCPYLYWTDDNHNYYVHREVAKAFPEICGEWFEGCEVHHIDCDPLNNEAKNLIVCTKAEHMRYHRQLREKQARLEELRNKPKDTRTFEEKLEEFRQNGKYSVCAYCRESKKGKSGLAPIEISISQSNKRYFHNTGLLCKPSEFKKKKYPEGFEEYVQFLTS